MPNVNKLESKTNGMGHLQSRAQTRLGHLMSIPPEQVGAQETNGMGYFI